VECLFHTPSVAAQVCNTLFRGLYLDSKGPNGSNNIKQVPKNPVQREHWIKLPDGCRSLHMSNLCDNAHKVSNGKVHNMCETGKAILLSAETVNAIGVKCRLDVVTCCVVVAGVICSYAEELSKYISC
jgi:hypothetical protein